METEQADRKPTAETLGHNEIGCHLKLKNPIYSPQVCGFVVGESFGLQRSFAALSRFGLPHRGHRLFGNVGFLW